MDFKTCVSFQFFLLVEKNGDPLNYVTKTTIMKHTQWHYPPQEIIHKKSPNAPNSSKVPLFFLVPFYCNHNASC